MQLTRKVAGLVEKDWFVGFGNFERDWDGSCDDRRRRLCLGSVRAAECRMWRSSAGLACVECERIQHDNDLLLLARSGGG